MKLSKDYVDAAAEDSRNEVEKTIQDIDNQLEIARRDQTVTVGWMEDHLKSTKSESEDEPHTDVEEVPKKKSNPNAGRKGKCARSFISAAGYAIETVNAVHDYLKDQFQAVEQDPNIKDKKTQYLNILMAAYDAGVWGKGKSPSIKQLAIDFKQIDAKSCNTMYSKAKTDKTKYRGDTYQAVKNHLKSLLS